MSKINLMEVCGTHTMEIAKAGIKSLLPPDVHLLSGPGCPVCVTPSEVIDAAFSLSEKQDVIITTYGDMLKVPGSIKGDSLNRRRAQGAEVMMVYSPMDALELAKKRPDKEIVFLGVGFETTAPGTAACIKAAKSEGVQNFSVFCMLKKIEPALRLLLEGSRGCKDGIRSKVEVDGLLCPGHVAVILGEAGFRFLPEEYGMPAVIAGFEPVQILTAVKHLLLQIEDGQPRLENAYREAVSPEGNRMAEELLAEVFETVSGETGKESYADLWRGLGMVPGSGFRLKEDYAEYDAVKKHGVTFQTPENNPVCRCGDVICARINPRECPLFGTACTPSDPEGPCMVSGEGACAAAYRYER